MFAETAYELREKSDIRNKQCSAPVFIVCGLQVRHGVALGLADGTGPALAQTAHGSEEAFSNGRQRHCLCPVLTGFELQVHHAAVLGLAGLILAQHLHRQFPGVERPLAMLAIFAWPP